MGKHSFTRRKINTVKHTVNKSQGPNLYEVLVEWKQDSDLAMSLKAERKFGKCAADSSLS